MKKAMLTVLAVSLVATALVAGIVSAQSNKIIIEVDTGVYYDDIMSRADGFCEDFVASGPPFYTRYETALDPLENGLYIDNSGDYPKLQGIPQRAETFTFGVSGTCDDDTNPRGFSVDVKAVGASVPNIGTVSAEATAIRREVTDIRGDVDSNSSYHESVDESLASLRSQVATLEALVPTFTPTPEPVQE